MRGLRRLAKTPTALVVILLALAQASASQRPTAAPTTATRDIAARSMRSLVVVLNLDRNGEVRSYGSGFVFRSGVVATNSHVIDGASRILVRQSGQDTSFRATVMRDSSRVDLALLRVDGLKVPPLALGQDSTVAVGDPVFAVGNPKGLEATFSDGLVSAKRTLDGVAVLQITAPISPGSSGGPILDRQGRVIGVAVGKIEGGDLLNFAIPVSNLLRLEAGASDVAADAASDGRARPESKGQTLEDLCQEFLYWSSSEPTVAGGDGAKTSAERVSRVEVNGNWLVIETTAPPTVSDDEPIYVTVEFLLSDVTDVQDSDDGLVVLTNGDKVKTKRTSGSACIRELSERAVLPSPNGGAALLMGITIEAMVKLAKGNPAGDARAKSGPSVEATVEFIRTQLAIHGHSKGVWEGLRTGTRYSAETRTRSFDVRGGVVILVTEEREKILGGSSAGGSLPLRVVRQSFRLADMGVACVASTDKYGKYILVAPADGEPVTTQYEEGGTSETEVSRFADIPFGNDDARPRVIKALNYLIDLAHEQKEEDPF